MLFAKRTAMAVLASAGVFFLGRQLHVPRLLIVFLGGFAGALAWKWVNPPPKR